MSDRNAAVEAKCRHCGTVIPPGVAFCSHCGARSEIKAESGDPLLARLRDLFGNELEFERELGRGGMAVVYAAFDTALERRVAVKSVLPAIASSPDIVARFLREARTVAALQHPHVVSVYSVRGGDGVSAIVMQYVAGRSLDLILKERSPLPLSVAGLLLVQIAGALQHAHDRGVVHRDVKPANVLIDREGNAVVSDFGIARRDGNTRITNTGMVVGTMAYMSPEQRRGGSTGPASDQYAFGVMAFELLAGRRPFVGPLAEMHQAHLTSPPPSLREFRPELSPAIEALVLRMLAKEPGDRHPNLRELERAFKALIPDSRTTALMVAGYTKSPAAAAGSRVQAAVKIDAVADDARAPDVAPAIATSNAPQNAPSGKRLSRAGAVVLGSLLIVVAVAVVWRSSGRAVAPATAVPNTLTSAAVAPPSSATAPMTTPAAGAPANSSATHTDSPAQRGSARPNASGAGQAGAATGRQAPGSRGAANSAPVGALTPGSLSKYPGGDSATARDASRSPATAPGEATPGAHGAIPAATTADARSIAREFVTLLNQRRWRELDQLGTLSGDTKLRTELVQLTQRAQDFAAGFDRVASPPEPSGENFLTECVIDLQWRGGHKLVLVHLRAATANGAWHLAAFGAESAD